MFSSYSTSNFTMESMVDNLMPGAISISDQMMQSLAVIQQNPNPSPTDLAAFQAQMQLYSSIIEMMSSITQDMGSVMKQIATNIGS